MESLRKAKDGRRTAADYLVCQIEAVKSKQRVVSVIARGYVETVCSR